MLPFKTIGTFDDFVPFLSSVVQQMRVRNNQKQDKTLHVLSTVCVSAARQRISTLNRRPVASPHTILFIAGS